MPRRVLREGDLLSIDFGAIVDGWHGDAAVTVAVGEVSPGGWPALSGGLRDRAVGRAGGRSGPVRGSPTSRTRSRPRSRRSQGRTASSTGYGGHGIGSEHAHGSRTCSTTAARAGARSCVAGMALADRADDRPRRAGHRGARRRLDRGHRGRLAGPPTGSTPSPSPRTVRGCSPPTTAERPSSRPSGGLTWAGPRPGSAEELVRWRQTHRACGPRMRPGPGRGAATGASRRGAAERRGVQRAAGRGPARPDHG